MPMLARKPCRHTGCGNLTDAGYCEQHTKQRRQVYDQHQRPARHKFYDTSIWERARRAKINRVPYCELCRAAGRFELAVIVHHRKPIETHPELALDPVNLESVCQSCHSRLHAATSFEGTPLAEDAGS